MTEPPERLDGDSEELSDVLSAFPKGHLHELGGHSMSIFARLEVEHNIHYFLRTWWLLSQINDSVADNRFLTKLPLQVAHSILPVTTALIALLCFLGRKQISRGSQYIW